MILPILTIIAAWTFGLPYAWQVTLTVFASLQLFSLLISAIKRAAGDE